MIGTCKLNNKSMRNVRREDAYQAMAIDLAMLGVISKEECEMLIGGGIPSGIMLPNGDRGKIVSEADLPKQSEFIKTEETEETEETVDETQETQDTEDKLDGQPEPIPGVTEMPDET